MIIQQTRQQAEQHELELKNCFNEFQGLYLGKIETLETKLEDSEKQYKVDLAGRDEEIKLMGDANAAVTEVTNAQVSLLKSTQEQTFTVLQGQIQTIKHDAQTTRRSLESALDRQIFQLSTANSKLQDSESKNRENERKNQRNEERIRGLQQQLGWAQEELADSGGFCVIS